MISVGPFTIICTSQADVAKWLRLFGKTATSHNDSSVSFENGATIARKTGTKPPPPPPPEIDITDFMAHRRPSAQPTPRH